MSKGTKKADTAGQRQSAHAARGRLPDLQGRDKDIALIDHLIDRVDRGGSALVISGEAGIGKSALLDIARHRAMERDFTVLNMTGVLAEVHLPYAALEQALRPLAKQVSSLVPRQKSALLSAFGVQGEGGAPDLFLVALATLFVLSESATNKPILLLADDVQWLDQATHDVLSFISRRVSSDPVILLVAIRDGFERPFGDADTLRLRLSGLDDADAGRLLDSHALDLSPELRNRFLREAAGNPLGLLELPHGECAAVACDVPWLPLTERLERAFLSRLPDLPDTARTLLFVAAENDGTSLEEVLRAGEVVLGERIGIDALSPAIAANLIEVRHDEVRFRHPLVRSALHQVADLAKRQQIHAALAATIRGQLDRRLWHRAAAIIGPDDELADEHDRMAERALRRGAVAMAIEVLENAARLSTCARSRCNRLLRAAELAADLGQPDVLERLLRQVDVEESDKLTSVRIDWCREISKPPAVHDPAKVACLVDFAAQADAAGAKDLAINLLWRAAQRCWWSSADAALRASVLASASRLGLPDEDPRLTAISAYVEPLRRSRKVLGALQNLSAVDRGDPAIARIIATTPNIIGAFDFSVSLLSEVSDSLRAQGRLGELARVLFTRGWAEMEIGNWAGAMREAEESARLAEETGGTLWMAAATILKAKLVGLQGNVDESEAFAAQAERLLMPVGAGFLRTLLQIARGAAAIGAGQHWLAYEQLHRVFTPGDPAFNSGLEFFALAYFVEAAVFSDNTDSTEVARRIAGQIEHASAPAPLPWVQTMLYYGKALLAAPEDAEQWYLRGLESAARNWPFLRGRLLLAYGGWLRRQRRSAAARAPLREAREIFDALGASPWSNRAREELRASGECSRHRTERPWEALTPQELHIAQLAAEGLSNKEIGIRLYLSHRTVGYHLHRIFSKTGITSRSMLGPMLAGVENPTG